MRDTRRSRIVLVVLLVVSFALITVDIHGGRNSPVSRARDWSSAVFGPAERAATTATDPIARAFDAVKDASSHEKDRKRLQQENAKLRQQVADVQIDRNRAAEMDRLLHVASVAQYKIKPARVVAVGPAQGFSWTITIDAGSRDGITSDMTVLNGDGLVGRVTYVGPMTATVLLATDPGFSVGSRMAASMEIGITSGQGNRPLRMQLLNGQAKVKKGDRLVTFGSQGGRPFVPGVPVGTVVAIDSVPGALTKTVEVRPFAHFTSLDTVGVVVEPPRTDPRDALLAPPPPPAPPAAAAAPAPATPVPGTPATPGASPAPGQDGSTGDPNQGTGPTNDQTPGAPPSNDTGATGETGAAGDGSGSGSDGNNSRATGDGTGTSSQDAGTSGQDDTESGTGASPPAGTSPRSGSTTPTGTPGRSARGRN